jgi:serine protease DegQ
VREAANTSATTINAMINSVQNAASNTVPMPKIAISTIRRSSQITHAPYPLLGDSISGRRGAFRTDGSGDASGVRGFAWIGAALALAGCSPGDDDEPVEPVAAPPTAATPDTTLGDVPGIIASVGPSVVTVFTQTSQGAGSGSGVIWDDDGRIVTNFHVVRAAGDVQVALADGTRLAARVVGTDERTDLAVLEVERDGLPAAEFADALPRVGELAIALGSPLGLANSASAGIVSALHRNLPSGGTTPALVDLLQTDAAISPGNSGGALVNGDGVVIGVNVAYIPPQARAVSIGFAIPSPVVLDVVPQLIEDGEADHAYLGVIPAPVTDELARAFNLGVEGGALLQDVTAGSPAADAGLRPGDVIVRLAGDEIATVEDLYAAVRRHEPGEQVELVVVRGGERTTVRITLGELPD